MGDWKLVVGTLLGTLIVVFGGTWLLSWFGSSPATRQSDITVNSEELVTQNAHVLAKGEQENYQFTIVVFSDFFCPACRAVEPRLVALVEKYPQQVRLVFRHFPLLNLHPQAMVVAQVAEAATQQGKFWPVHDVLFASQSQLNDLSRTDLLNKIWELLSVAGIENLDIALLEQNWDEPEIAQLVQNDLNQARELKLSFTPSIFLNGELMPIDQVETEIESQVN